MRGENGAVQLGNNSISFEDLRDDRARIFVQVKAVYSGRGLQFDRRADRARGLLVDRPGLPQQGVVSLARTGVGLT
jgi:hypothetical protein